MIPKVTREEYEERIRELESRIRQLEIITAHLRPK